MDSDVMSCARCGEDHLASEYHGGACDVCGSKEHSTKQHQESESDQNE